MLLTGCMHVTVHTDLMGKGWQRGCLSFALFLPVLNRVTFVEGPPSSSLEEELLSALQLLQPASGDKETGKSFAIYTVARMSID